MEKVLFAGCARRVSDVDIDPIVINEVRVSTHDSAEEHPAQPRHAATHCDLNVDLPADVGQHLCYS